MLMMSDDVLLQPHRVIDLPLLHQGKVRDIFTLRSAPDKLLFVVSDRISAYDVVMGDGIPGKGRVLNEMAAFWLAKTRDIVGNHMISINPDDYPSECAPYHDYLIGRSMLVKKGLPLPIECIVRGNLTGSYWSAYQEVAILEQKTESPYCKKQYKLLHGFELPADMQESEKFVEPLFTPSTKAGFGEHDENISFNKMVEIMQQWLLQNHFHEIDATALCIQVKFVSQEIFVVAREYAKVCGITIADTKLEYVLSPDGTLLLADEVLTPDSSRFWSTNQVVLGQAPPSFDKDYLRRWLSQQDWNKTYPPPNLPREVIEITSQKYHEALARLVLDDFL